jgi:hypothetical protein
VLRRTAHVLRVTDGVIPLTIGCDVAVAAVYRDPMA